MPFRKPKMPNWGPWKDAPPMAQEAFNDLAVAIICFTLGFPDLEITGETSPEIVPAGGPMYAVKEAVPETWGQLKDISQAQDDLVTATKHATQGTFNLTENEAAKAIARPYASTFRSNSAVLVMSEQNPPVIILDNYTARNMVNLIFDPENLTDSDSLDSLVYNDFRNQSFEQAFAEISKARVKEEIAPALELAPSFGYVPVNRPMWGIPLILVKSALKDFFSANLILSALELPSIAKYVE